MMGNELAIKQEEDLFSTQPILDPKSNRPMSIQEHINRDRMKKVQSEKPISFWIIFVFMKKTSSIMNPMRKYAN